MATYTIPGQNLSYEIPDAGETFLIKDTAVPIIGYRSGNQLFTTNYQELGRQVAQQQGRDPNTIGGGDLISLGADYFNNLGLTPKTRTMAELADINSFFTRTGGFGMGSGFDLNFFKTSVPTNTGEVITQTTAPDNPQGALVTSNTQGTVSQSPSTQQALMNAGATPQQAGTLAATAQQNAQANTGPVPVPYSPEQLAAAGVKPPEPVQLTPQAPQQIQQPSSLPASTYTGPSIVDYLNSVGQASDFASRSRLAAQAGIQNYTGTAEQNTQLLNMLRSNSGSPSQASQDVQGSTTVGGAPQQQVTPQQMLSDLLGSYGISSNDLSSLFPSNQSPQKSIKDMVTDIMSSLGMPDVKKNIESMSKELEDLANERDKKIRDIDDNPWYTEGKRVAEIQKVGREYEDKMKNRTARLQLMQDAYEDARQEAQYAAGLAVNMYQNERAFLQNQLEFIVGRAEKAAELRAAQGQVDPSLFKEVQGGLYDIASGRFVVQPNQGSDLKTTLTEVGGRRILINSQTGERIADIGPVASPDGKLSADTAKVLTIAETMIPEIQQLKKAFQGNYRGSILGITSGTDRTLVKLVDQVADKIGRLRSGGAINKDEEERFRRQIVSIRDAAFGSPDGTIAALDGYLAEAQSVVSNIKGGSGSGGTTTTNGWDFLGQTNTVSGWNW